MKPQEERDAQKPVEALDGVRLPAGTFSCRLEHRFWVALLLAVLVMAVALGMDWFLLRQARWSPMQMAGISDGILGLIVFLLLFRLLRHAHRHQQQIVQRLEVIDEMNHHIRSALQVISFNVRPAAGNEWELAEIKQSIERIQWTLREILPKLEPEFQPFESSPKSEPPDTK